MSAQPIARWIKCPGDPTDGVVSCLGDDGCVVLTLQSQFRTLAVHCRWVGPSPSSGDGAHFRMLAESEYLAYPLGHELFVQVADLMVPGSGPVLTGLFQVSEVSPV